MCACVYICKRDFIGNDSKMSTSLVPANLNKKKKKKKTRERDRDRMCVFVCIHLSFESETTWQEHAPELP